MPDFKLQLTLNGIAVALDGHDHAANYAPLVHAHSGMVTVTGVPVAGRLTSWVDANRVQDAGVAITDLALVGHSHPATTDHGALTGLADDDHPQYVNITTAQNVNGLKSFLDGVYVRSDGPNTEIERLITGASAYSQVVLQLRVTNDVSSIDSIGPALSFHLNDLETSTDNMIALIAAGRNGADNSGSLIFYTYKLGSPGQRMAIDASGNVFVMKTLAVGHSNIPDDVLEVDGNIRMASAQTVSDAVIGVLNYENNNAPGPVAAMWAIRRTVNYAADLLFGTRSGGSVGERMRITAEGNVHVLNQLNVSAGASAGQEARVGGVMYTSVTPVGNLGAGEDNLMTYAIPANTLSTNVDSIWFEAFGTINAVNANNKTLRVRLGTSGTNLILTCPTVTNQRPMWRLSGRIYRTGATAQLAIVEGVLYMDSANSTPVMGVAATLNQTLTGIVTLRITGEAVASNDIVCQSLIVGWNPANV